MATEAKTKSTSKKIVAEKPVKAVAKDRSSAKKTENKKAVMGSDMVKVTQLVGTIGRRHDQEATLKGLGLNKRHRTRVLEDTPSVRGMIYKVRHLLKVESAN